MFIILEHKEGRIVFDTLDPTIDGVLMTVRMTPMSNGSTSKALVTYDVSPPTRTPHTHCHHKACSMYTHKVHPSTPPNIRNDHTCTARTNKGDTGKRTSTPSNIKVNKAKCPPTPRITKAHTHNSPYNGDAMFRDLFYDEEGNSTWTKVSGKKSKHNKIKNKTTTTVTPPSVNRRKDKINNVSSTRSPTFDINQFHSIMGHVNERYLRQTAEYYNYELNGTLSTCVHCALANIRRIRI